MSLSPQSHASETSSSAFSYGSSVRSKSSSPDTTESKKKDDSIEQEKPRRRRISDPHSFPSKYEVFTQARVRSGYEFTSSHITDLPEGSIVTVEEIKGNRARISKPFKGWISVVSKTNDYNTIILPINQQTAKIGGKVIITSNIPNKAEKYSVSATISGYNQYYNLHEIKFKHGHTQWVDLKDSHIRYIPKKRAKRYIDPIQQNEAFFLQFFVRDYPEFKPSKDIKGNSHRSSVMKSGSARSTVQRLADHGKNVGHLHEKRSDIEKVMDKDKSRKMSEREEFRKKIKNMEQKVIDHLHHRGYYEDNPEFWRYIEKARKLAIHKATQERAKIIKQQQFEKQTINK